MPEKLNEYNERFGEGFPMIPLGWGRTDEQVMAIIEECLEKNKDVYELGYVKEEEVY